GVDVELLVRVAERDRPDLAVQLGAARVAAVLVAEAAARDRVDGRVPGRVELAVRADHGVAVVDLLRARVVRARLPDAERGRGAGRRAERARRIRIAAGRPQRRE